MANVTGTAEADQLSGSGSADTIVGGRGTDLMTGGSGADVFVFSIGDGGGLPHDVIIDFELGVDRLSLPAGAALHTEDDPAGQWVHYGDDRGNNDWIQLRGVRGATLDQLTSGGTSPSTTPTAGDDSITGAAGADTINALAGNDTVNAGDGADFIIGGPGTDQLTGGAGVDVFFFRSGDGGSLPHDVITDFQLFTDRLAFFTGERSPRLHTEDDVAGQWVHYGADLGNNDWVLLLGVHGATFGHLLGTASPPASAGNDTLIGDFFSPIINALAGDDIVSARNGSQTITGGPGTDQVTGGREADVFVFNYGDGGSLPHDVIRDFHAGEDRLQFPAGAALYTEDDPAGQWVHYGDDLGNNDWVQLRGVHGATLARLTGVQDGVVTRIGFFSEPDIAAGTPGKDIFAVGFDPGGAPRSEFTTWTLRSFVGEGRRDVIQNFEQGVDIIDLGRLNQDSDPERDFFADDNFEFIGTRAFTPGGAAQPQLRYELQEGRTVIQMDGATLRGLGGGPGDRPPAAPPDGVADAEIELVGIYVLVASDFIL